MKKSVICIMGIIFIMMFSITSTTTSFGADLVNPKDVVGLEFKNLPKTMKIDPNVIGAMRGRWNNHTLTQFKNQWKAASDAVLLVNAVIPQLDSSILLLKQKEEECMNKTYTLSEAIAAGCQDNLFECSKILFDNCRRDAREVVLGKCYDLLIMIGPPAACTGCGGVIGHGSDALRSMDQWCKAL